MGMAQIGADHHILQHSHVLEGSGYLEGAADAGTGVRFGRRTCHVVTGENDFAFGRHGVACQTVEKSGFAGAVRTDHSYDLSLISGQGRLAQGKEAGECFGNLLRFKKHSYASSAAVRYAPTTQTVLPVRSAR